jgi:hypothetical protein
MIPHAQRFRRALLWQRRVRLPRKGTVIPDAQLRIAGALLREPGMTAFVLLRAYPFSGIQISKPPFPVLGSNFAS